MIDKFLEGVSSKLADRAVASIFSPGFLFLVAGVGAWLYAHGGGRGWQDLQDRFRHQDGATLIVLSAGVLLLLWAGGLVIQRLTLPALRLLEGYWPRPLAGPKTWLVKRVQRRYQKAENEFQALAAKRDEKVLSGREADRYVVLDEKLAVFPSDPSRVLPTRVGNVLRAAEARPREKFGLDATKIWPQFVLILPDTTRAELEASRVRVDTAVAALIWSLLFAVWAVWAWWAVLLSIVASATVYRWWVLEAATRYGELIQATFDVHRFLLYGALRLVLPDNPRDELRTGEELTKYVVRGSDQDQPIFQHPDT